MRSKRISFRCPWTLCDKLEDTAKAFGFRSASRMLLAAVLLLFRHQELWNMVKVVANADPKLQDRLIQKFTDLPKELLSNHDDRAF